uniref:Uncharacterized protein n=1 Tax=Sphaerodactylus townsendi TaxID=933632 RepID=A0ACB8EZG6_9SAUR
MFLPSTTLSSLHLKSPGISQSKVVNPISTLGDTLILGKLTSCLALSACHVDLHTPLSVSQGPSCCAFNLSQEGMLTEFPWEYGKPCENFTLIFGSSSPFYAHATSHKTFLLYFTLSLLNRDSPYFFALLFVEFIDHSLTSKQAQSTNCLA